MVDFLYLQRHSKHVQRRMVVDACRRLERVFNLAGFTYVGFGSYEFVDFELVRRDLGVIQMESIEIDPRVAARASFNIPFEGVTVTQGHSNNVLPGILSDIGRAIVWLDYTDRLTTSVIEDLETCITHLPPGSVVLITVRADPEGAPGEWSENLEGAVERRRVPRGYTEDQLGDRFPEVQRRILVNALRRPLAQRRQAARFLQLFDIIYRDSATMQTWGGVVTGPRLAYDRAVELFDGLPHVSLPGRPTVEVNVPPLTTREVIHLNGQLPARGGLSGTAIPEDQLEAYRQLYRWYPRVPAAM